MNRNPGGQRAGRVYFSKPRRCAPCLPNLAALRQSEREAYQCILGFLRGGEMSEVDKMLFLRAVDTLAGAVRGQDNVSMSDYVCKTLLARTIEALMLEEGGGELTSSVRQQAMLSIVALSQVDPPFPLEQKLDLVTAAVACVFSLPLILPSQDGRDRASLYLQTVQALDDMLQALVMEGLGPSMTMLQRMLEIILPWLTLSDKEQEQTRAAYAVAHMLRFTCNFPELLHLGEFSISGRLMGTLGIFCMSRSPQVSAGASEGLHYLFKVLVLHRSQKHKTELILKDLQKHFRGEWLVYIEDLTMFFREFLTPEERMDAIMVFMEAMTSAKEDHVRAASKILTMILRSSMPEIGKVPEIVEFIYHNMNRITEATAQETMRKVLQRLAQAYADDVILTLLKVQDQSYSKGNRKPWEILAAIPQSYVMIMEHLLQRLTLPLKRRAPEASDRTQISPLIATRAIHELLLEPSRRTEVQVLFPPLFMALLIQTSFLVVQGGAGAAQSDQNVTKWTDPVSSTVEALKALVWGAGYGELVSAVQTLGGWGLLTSPERHYEGVTVLARAMVSKECWHNRPVFSLIIQMLQEQDYKDHRTALELLPELLRSRDVAAAVDEAATRVLASWFPRGEPATVMLLLRAAETFTLHGDLAPRLSLLQPQVLRCLHAEDPGVLREAFRVLRALVEHCARRRAPSFLVQLVVSLRPLFEAEAEPRRLMAFEIYGALLAKVKRPLLAPRLRQQLLSTLVLLVVHLADRDARVAQVCRLALHSLASLLGWWRLRPVFANGDLWTILRALLEREAGRGQWLLTQSLTLLQSPQAPIRQAAVWFTGQIIQSPAVAKASDAGTASEALRSMSEDPDPAVSCLATQTLHVLEASRSQPARTRTCWLCCWRR
uniref:Maestro heat like repeat family member 1 n=1 Tax=Pipistrellus kuhlii TaxID=59472 RepID=A0A7J7QS19_PIPKU|nr:hypothetical protein mPipKuh1_008749 [Pipistrellus kuhlii]